MPQTVSASSEVAVVRVGDARWMSYHLLHPGDREALLTRVVRPVALDLWADGSADRFFFIRYEEGGKHLRLRLRVSPGIETTVATTRASELLEAYCARFRESLVASGADPTLDIVPASLELEVERYGGPRFFPRALSFFALSSLDAIRFVEHWGSVPRARQLTEILVRLSRQAIGLARTATELRELADYVVQWRPRMEPIVARAAQMFESRGDHFTSRVREVLAAAALSSEVSSAPLPGTPEAQVAHARHLAAALDGLEGEARWRALGSQMHMAANRLGLNNPEESYLSAILCRCLEALGAELDELVAAASSRAAASAPACAPGTEASAADAALDAVVAAAIRTFFTRGDQSASDSESETNQ